MSYIIVSGFKVLMDKEDIDRFSSNWFTIKHKGNSKGMYARTVIKGKSKYLHRMILNLTDPKIHVDHINGDTLDNRKINLRTCTNRENTKNKKAHKKKRATIHSKYKGIHFIPEYKRWRAKICVDYKSISLGCYSSEEEAALAYDKAAREYFGEYARLNFPEEG